jgi:hypothetical protein
VSSRSRLVQKCKSASSNTHSTISNRIANSGRIASILGVRLFRGIHCFPPPSPGEVTVCIRHGDIAVLSKSLANPMQHTLYRGSPKRKLGKDALVRKLRTSWYWNQPSTDILENLSCCAPRALPFGRNFHAIVLDRSSLKVACVGRISMSICRSSTQSQFFERAATIGVILGHRIHSGPTKILLVVEVGHACDTVADIGS